MSIYKQSAGLTIGSKQDTKQELFFPSQEGYIKTKRGQRGAKSTGVVHLHFNTVCLEGHFSVFFFLKDFLSS